MKEADNCQLIFKWMFHGDGECFFLAVFYIGLETGPAATNEIM